jgi:hypothetical protein
VVPSLLGFILESYFHSPNNLRQKPAEHSASSLTKSLHSESKGEVVSIHRAAEKGSSRQLGFRHTVSTTTRYPSVHCAVARATTTAMIIKANTAWIIDRTLARLLMIEVSVGPKAVLWLKARNR